MDYLERYKNGEHQQVWDELQKLGAEVFEEPYAAQAEAVAVETMHRVRRNCERLISHLQSLGYVFGTFPSGKRRSYTVEPLTPPSEQMQADVEELETVAGPLPLSLKVFWREVGAVDFVGMHPSWPDGLDPLVVDPPEGALAMLYDLEEYDEDGEEEGWFVALAPDDLHKDNISGGDPYGVHLPSPAADTVFLDEHHNLFFVPYLRFAILQWGGLPGLEEDRGMPFEPLEGLIADLEPF